MRFKPIVVLWVIGTCTAVFAEEGFAPLFDGKSLDGCLGNRQVFRVESGAIVAGTLKERIPHNEFLSAQQEYSDFELRLEAKLIGDVRIQPLSGDLIAPGAEVTKLADGFAFTEGPACDKDGNIYFSDVRNSRTHIWSVDGKLSTFREETGNGNGLYFDTQGNLLVCEGGNRRVTSVAPNGKLTVLADRYAGKPFNSPNDLWIDPQGGVYFTDPRYGRGPELQQDGHHVYYVAPDRESVTRIVNDLVKPNGIIGTRDGKTLYIADAGDNKTYRYHIQPDATLTDKTLFVSQGSDGMTLDERGNLYLTQRVVTVYSPAGEKLMDIEVPESPANVCFGGKDRDILFITARKGLYALKMNVRSQ